MPLTRRQLGRTAAAGAAALALPAFHPVPRRNEELRVGVVGLRGRGNNHVDALRRLPDVRVVGLCDVDEGVLAQRLQEAARAGDDVKGHADVRDLLDRDDVDAITIATPNHTHALFTVWACQAGKDVYVEKPISHNVWEGRQAVAAARKYGRIVQAGTQSRSSHAIRDGIAWLHEGHLGAVTHAWGTCFKPRRSIGKVDGPQPVPEGVRYDLWCGPTGVRPLTRRNLHYDWHWQFATGNGDLGNQGIHQVDLCRWGLGHDHLAPAVWSVGGRFGYDDDGDTPNTQFVFLDYPGRPMVFEVRGLPRDTAAREGDWGKGMDQRNGCAIGATIHAEGGMLVLPNYSEAVARDAEGKEVRRWQGADDHFANWVGAVRSRKVEELNSDVREGHLSSALCHLGTDSHRLGRESSPQAIADALPQAPLCHEGLERFRAHLAAHGVDLERERAVLGRPLRVDPVSERYLDDPEATALWRGTYAEGFEVPEIG